jgi:pimeloyl-ACP methyl ester carboxylesterase
MGRRFVVSFLASALALAPLVAPTAARAAGDPSPGSPEWQMRDADNMATAGTGRWSDEFANPAFGREFNKVTPGTFTQQLTDQYENPTRPMVTLGTSLPGGTTGDPFRVHWGDGPNARGTQIPIEYFNRYGARITGNVWAPRDLSGCPCPSIVITTGSIQGDEELYWWAAQGLAEAGYIVMTYDVQGQGQSETLPHDATAFCDPLSQDPNATWKQPQEDGQQETGPCAGVPFQQSPNFVLGTWDALAWFRSGANPLRAEVDDNRVGLAGHSLGAGAVTIVGNDPPANVKTVVAWDNAGLPANETPLVPTMGQNAEYFFNPSPTNDLTGYETKSTTFRRFQAAGVPSMQVALRHSTHLEWSFVPWILPADHDGERVAMYYTLAWFDRYLRGDTAAEQRLTAATFDGSADASAIGAGSYDVATDTNVPWKIAGQKVADHLSFYYRSAYAFGANNCEDMRAGC